MINLLALPHSSAYAERIFSLVNNIKVKNRSLLKTETLNSLLYSKSLLSETNCTKWRPSQELLKLMSQENLYEKDTEQDTTF